MTAAWEKPASSFSIYRHGLEPSLLPLRGLCVLQPESVLYLACLSRAAVAVRERTKWALPGKDARSVFPLGIKQGARHYQEWLWAGGLCVCAHERACVYLGEGGLAEKKTLKNGGVTKRRLKRRLGDEMFLSGLWTSRLSVLGSMASTGDVSGMSGVCCSNLWLKVLAQISNSKVPKQEGKCRGHQNRLSMPNVRTLRTLVFVLRPVYLLCFFLFFSFC